MRKFAITLNRWDEKDSNGRQNGKSIRHLTYEQKEGVQNTIKDVKNWILMMSLENNDDLCTCFLSIWKYFHYDNKQKKIFYKNAIIPTTHL